MTTNDPGPESILRPVIMDLRAEYNGTALTTITVTEHQKAKYKKSKFRLALQEDIPKKLPDPVMVGLYCWAYDQVQAASEDESYCVPIQPETKQSDLPSLTLGDQRQSELKSEDTTTLSVMDQQLAKFNLRKNRDGHLAGKNNGLSSRELFDLMDRAYHWLTTPLEESDYKLTA